MDGRRLSSKFCKSMYRRSKTEVSLRLSKGYVSISFLLISAISLLVPVYSLHPMTRWNNPLPPMSPERAGNLDPESQYSINLEDTSVHELPESIQNRRAFVGLILLAAAGSSVFPDDAAAIDPSNLPPDQTTLPSEIVSSSAGATPSINWNEIFQKASKKALGGGRAGASAAVVQVLCLMWLRTSMNYQYAKGGNLASSLKELWNEGGIPRLYQGLPFALVQGPLTRFGDTAANVGILALLESTPETQSLPLPVKTALGSISAGLWRIFLMPIDASKTAMQVEGKEGFQRLWGLVAEEGPTPLYNGALAQASATAAGHFPWFLTYNFVDASIPPITSSDDLLLSLARSAFLGLCASCVSDIASNSLRVIKTTKQTARLRETNLGSDSSQDLSYPEIVQMIIEQDGVLGLLGRGLQTRLLTNAIQGAVFSVLWKYFQSQS
jgi:Mitochondrial carrier protein